MACTRIRDACSGWVLAACGGPVGASVVEQVMLVQVVLEGVEQSGHVGRARWRGQPVDAGVSQVAKRWRPGPGGSRSALPDRPMGPGPGEAGPRSRWHRRRVAAASGPRYMVRALGPVVPGGGAQPALAPRRSLACAISRRAVVRVGAITRVGSREPSSSQRASSEDAVSQSAFGGTRISRRFIQTHDTPAASSAPASVRVARSEQGWRWSQEAVGRVKGGRLARHLAERHRPGWVVVNPMVRAVVVRVRRRASGMGSGIGSGRLR